MPQVLPVVLAGVVLVGLVWSLAGEVGCWMAGAGLSWLGGAVGTALGVAGAGVRGWWAGGCRRQLCLSWWGCFQADSEGVLGCWGWVGVSPEVTPVSCRQAAVASIRMEY